MQGTRLLVYDLYCNQWLFEPKLDYTAPILFILPRCSQVSRFVDLSSNSLWTYYIMFKQEILCDIFGIKYLKFIYYVLAFLVLFELFSVSLPFCLKNTKHAKCSLRANPECIVWGYKFTPFTFYFLSRLFFCYPCAPKTLTFYCATSGPFASKKENK